MCVCALVCVHVSNDSEDSSNFKCQAADQCGAGKKTLYILKAYLFKELIHEAFLHAHCHLLLLLSVLPLRDK